VKNLVIGVAALFGMLVLLWQVIRVLGARLPESHRASQHTEIAADIEAVSARIRDIESHPTWRHDLKRVQVTARTARGVEYREESGDGTISYVMREAANAPQFETEITDASLPFGGRWTYELSSVGARRVRVVITEDGIVRDPAFRFLSHHVFGYDRSLRRYLSNLAASFAGDPAGVSTSAAPSAQQRPH
jgi:hypothetical protein